MASFDTINLRPRHVAVYYLKSDTSKVKRTG